MAEAVATERRQWRATHRYARISARKARLVIDLIRGLPVNKAQDTLRFTRKRAAPLIAKVLASAIANAENNHNLDVDALVVKEATVGKSITMKRWTPRARGRSSKIMKMISRIRIVVREREDEAGE